MTSPLNRLFDVTETTRSWASKYPPKKLTNLTSSRIRSSAAAMVTNDAPTQKPAMPALSRSTRSWPSRNSYALTRLSTSFGFTCFRVISSDHGIITTTPERARPSASPTTRGSFEPAGFTPRNRSTALWVCPLAGVYRSAVLSPVAIGNRTSVREGACVTQVCGLTGTVGTTWGRKSAVLTAV